MFRGVPECSGMFYVLGFIDDQGKNKWEFNLTFNPLIPFVLYSILLKTGSLDNAIGEFSLA